eukprot:NODE_2418_length_1204_cov_83.806061_g2205_i0.p1 GENE.NODE_2418_length_1204_cov_83.806061_g2205_i0~~NODE_2418_length_1204_cov_83.806061_g2205_i0.p1  ORF type:complete len:314 (-),score=29.77 NODE_2418_length_1204_cov_83.806061_g2205_i0:195-1136(-)
MKRTGQPLALRPAAAPSRFPERHAFSPTRPRPLPRHPVHGRQVEVRRLPPAPVLGRAGASGLRPCSRCGVQARDRLSLTPWLDSQINGRGSTTSSQRASLEPGGTTAYPPGAGENPDAAISIDEEEELSQVNERAADRDYANPEEAMTGSGSVVADSAPSEEPLECCMRCSFMLLDNALGSGTDEMLPVASAAEVAEYASAQLDPASEALFSLAIPDEEAPLLTEEGEAAAEGGTATQFAEVALLTVSRLKAFCVQNQLPQKGRKRELIMRVWTHLQHTGALLEDRKRVRDPSFYDWTTRTRSGKRQATSSRE